MELCSSCGFLPQRSTDLCVSIILHQGELGTKPDVKLRMMPLKKIWPLPMQKRNAPCFATGEFYSIIVLHW